MRTGQQTPVPVTSELVVLSKFLKKCKQMYGITCLFVSRNLPLQSDVTHTVVHSLYASTFCVFIVRQVFTINLKSYPTHTDSTADKRQHRSFGLLSVKLLFYYTSCNSSPDRRNVPRDDV